MFVTIYRSLAEWRAVVERLDGFDQSVAAARAVAVAKPAIELTHGEADAVTLKDLAVRLPNGMPLVTASDISIKPGERVLVSGPSGVRQVDAVPRARRRLAVRLRHHRRCRKAPR